MSRDNIIDLFTGKPPTSEERQNFDGFIVVGWDPCQDGDTFVQDGETFVVKEGVSENPFIVKMSVVPSDD